MATGSPTEACVVVLSEMELELQQEAKACAERAIRHLESDTERAEFIKRAFDKQVSRTQQIWNRATWLPPAGLLWSLCAETTQSNKSYKRSARGQSHMRIAGHGQLFRLISRLISMSIFLYSFLVKFAFSFFAISLFYVCVPIFSFAL